MTLDSYNIFYAKYRIASGCDSTYFRLYLQRLEKSFVLVIIAYTIWKEYLLLSYLKADLVSNNGKIVVFLTDYHTWSSYNFSKNSEAQAYLLPLAETRAEQMIKK